VRWRDLSGFQPRIPQPHQQHSYQRRLARRPVRYALRHCNVFFVRQRRELSAALGDAAGARRR
jgi:hypothetical protein